MVGPSRMTLDVATSGDATRGDDGVGTATSGVQKVHGAEIIPRRSDGKRKCSSSTNAKIW